VAAAALSACDGGGDRLAVYAASSLSGVLPRLAPEAEHNFAASSTLATQIRAGAPADVLASADLGLARELAAEGRIDPPRLLATNRLVLLVASGNPAGIAAPADLRRDVRFVVADEGVPLGDYTRELLRRLGLQDLVRRAASYEADARGTVGKVALGEAEAAIAYATDAAAAGGAVEAIPLPATAQPRIVYAIAAVRGRPRIREARAYVARAVGREGRAALRAAGFGLP